MLRRAAGAALLVGLAGVACATTGSTGDGGDTERIEASELRSMEDRFGNLYQVVRQIRNQWLSSGGPTSLRDPSPSRPVVFLDGFEYGPAGALRRISVTSVEEVRYVTPDDATTRYGTGYPAGIIAVTTRSGG